MEQLVTVRFMADRYRCSLKTARRYLRQLEPHMENPLTAPMWALRDWEEKRTVIPDTVSRKRREEIMARRSNGRVIVPRTR